MFKVLKYSLLGLWKQASTTQIVIFTFLKFAHEFNFVRLHWVMPYFCPALVWIARHTLSQTQNCRPCHCSFSFPLSSAHLRNNIFLLSVLLLSPILLVGYFFSMLLHWCWMFDKATCSPIVESYCFLTAEMVGYTWSMCLGGSFQNIKILGGALRSFFPKIVMHEVFDFFFFLVSCWKSTKLTHVLCKGEN